MLTEILTQTAKEFGLDSTADLYLSSNLEARNVAWMKLAKAGWTDRAIAEEWCFTHPTVSKVLNRNGVYREVRGQSAGTKKKPKDDWDEITDTGRIEPGRVVWWAGYKATVIEDNGKSVRIKAYGDEYTVGRHELR